MGQAHRRWPCPDCRGRSPDRCDPGVLVHQEGSAAFGQLGRTPGQRHRHPRRPSGFRAYSRNAAARLSVINTYTYTLETIIQTGRKRIPMTWVPVRVNRVERPSRLFRGIGQYIARSAQPIRRPAHNTIPFTRKGHRANRWEGTGEGSSRRYSRQVAPRRPCRPTQPAAPAQAVPYSRVAPIGRL